MTDVPRAAPVTSLFVKAPLKPQSAANDGGFRVFLSELNPLQYIPVLGTLYRAVTGDRIPDTAREVGSLVVSGLTGGPVGVAINLGALAAEKVTGIDPEKWGGEALAAIGIGHATPPSPSVRTPAPQTATSPVQAAAAPKPRAWSSAELTAYGVQTAAGGALRHGVLSGADVLNDLELARHSRDNIG